MKTTMISILATALATVCSAAPTAAAAQSLPAKFTLKFTPREGTALNGFAPDVLGELDYGQSLYIGSPNGTGPLSIVPFLSHDSIVTITNNTPEFPGTLTIAPIDGWISIFPMVEPTTPRIAKGFGQVDGKLTWDNGSGPQALWNSCQNGSGHWVIFFNPSAQIKKTGLCLKVDLTVVPS